MREERLSRRQRVSAHRRLVLRAGVGKSHSIPKQKVVQPRQQTPHVLRGHNESVKNHGDDKREMGREGTSIKEQNVEARSCSSRLEIDNIFSVLQKRKPESSGRGSNDKNNITQRNSKSCNSVSDKKKNSSAVSGEYKKNSNSMNEKKNSATSGDSGANDQDLHVCSDNDDGFASLREPAKMRRRVGGLSVYTEDDLNIGKGGDTPLCPFEYVWNRKKYIFLTTCSCNCCF